MTVWWHPPPWDPFRLLLWLKGMAPDAEYEWWDRWEMSAIGADQAGEADTVMRPAVTGATGEHGSLGVQVGTDVA